MQAQAAEYSAATPDHLGFDAKKMEKRCLHWAKAIYDH